jgi:cytochrome c556
MKFGTKSLVACLILIAGTAYAEVEATNPDVIARQDLMKINGKNAKILGDMAGGKTSYDAATAEAAKAALIAASADIGAKFMTNAEDPGSKTKPEVWTNWDDFLKKAGALNAAATAIDVSSLENIQAGMAGIGGACKDCHTTYRN